MVRPSALQLTRHPLAALFGERARIVRFALTGSLAGLTQLLLLRFLMGQGLPALAANALAFLLAAQVNFWLSQTFTWADRRIDSGAGTVASRLLRFHGSILGTALLNMGVFAVAVTVLPETPAAVLGILAAAVANFVSGGRFVFRKPRLRAVHGATEASMSRAVVAAPERSTDDPVIARIPASRADGGVTPAQVRPSSDRRQFWERLGLAAVVLVAAGLYTWNLGRNGFGNEYYTAAALSGALSWKAFFFGALDPGSFITVDKPPLGVWLQALSVRLFGLSSWSVLLPQSLMALATLLAVIVMTRRQFGGPAAILAGLVLALTPITVATTRVNLPDTVLILVLVLGAWATLAAVRRGQLRLLLLGVALVGVGFNAKMLQAFVVAPAFFLTYLVAAPSSLLKRLAHLTLAGIVMLAVAASWMAVVDAIPPSARPYIGGSSNNTVLDLTLGYNGLGRVFGQGLARGADPAEIVARFTEMVRSAVMAPDTSDTVQGAQDGGLGGPGGPGFGGQPGVLRLFNQQIGGQIGWLLPLASAGLLAGLVATARRPRTDPLRAWYVLWGGWFVTHAVVFSFASGILHPYYTSALAPSVAALCGPGVVALWQGYQRRWWLTPALPATLGGTAALGVVLVSRSSWGTWLAPAIVGAVSIGAVGLVLARLIRRPIGRQLALGALTLGLAGLLIAPAAWAMTPLGGSGMAGNPLAGPVDSFGGGRGGPGGGAGGPPPWMLPPGTGQPPVGMQPPADQGSRGPRVWQGRNGGGNGPGIGPDAGAGAQPGAFPDGPDGPDGPGGRVSAALLDYLQAQRGSAEYLVAVNSSMAAAPIILETRQPVIAMGGFGGGDPAPTAEGLADLVQSGRLRFVLLGGRGGPGGGVGTERAAWVQASCSPVDASVYDPSAAGSRDQLYDCAPASAGAQP